MSTANSTIAGFAAQFQSFSADASKFFTDSAPFFASVEAFIANQSNPGNTTVLSAADQASINAMAAALPGLDAQAKTLDGTLSGIAIPAAPAPPASPQP